MGLFDILQGMPSLNEMKGNFGELLTKYYSKIMYDTLILHDILIDGAEDLTSQMDLLLIGETGIYVVEVKMFNDARIYGDGKRSTWYYYKGGKKYEIYSPLRQNKKHIEYLKKFLQDFGEVPCYSIITLICEEFKVTNINKNPDYITTAICSSLPSMNEAIKIISKDKQRIFDQEKRQEIYNYILNNQHLGKEARIKHKEKIKEIKKERESIKEKNLCPYCNTSLILRKGNYGEFYGCSNFPKCKYTQKI